jgi:anti-sigma-K factor RskA
MYGWQSLQKKLIAAARANPPGDHVPYAFEKRMMSLIAARGATDQLVFWVRGFWRAAASCVAIALLLGAWAFFNPAASNNKTDDLSQNFENTLLASVDQNDPAQ